MKNLIKKHAEILSTIDDAKQVGELVYSHFRDTYPDTVFYEANKLIHKIKKGSITCILIKTHGGKVIAHTALKKYNKENIYCAACSVVHRDYRKKGLALKLRKFLRDYLNSINNPGFYSELITTHPFLQKASVSIGGRETGFFLARISPKINYQLTNNNLWLNAMLFFHPTSEISQKISIRYTDYNNIISTILNKIGITNIEIINKTLNSTCNNIYFKIDVAWGIADLLIEDTNINTKKFWEKKLKKLEEHPVRAIFLNLSLPNINDLLEIFWEHKYFLVGIIPYFFETGSALVMQYASTLPYIRENHFASPFGQQIYEWCMADRERILSQN